MTKLKPRPKKAGDGPEAKIGHEKSHVKVPVDGKHLLKMHISHAIVNGLLKLKG